MLKGAMQGRDGEQDFRTLHARFARNVAAIFAAATIVGLLALVAALVSDLQYQRGDARQAVSVETELRAQYLGQHLALLASEVHRLGERPEIDLLDKEIGPEQRLLASSHDNSTIFNRGIALLDRSGARVWSEPESFLQGTIRPIPPAVLHQLTGADAVQIIPSPVDAPHEAVLYVAMPIRQERVVTGVLLGAIDLVATQAVDIGFRRRTGSEVVLATQRGHLLYPPEEQRDAPVAAFVAARVRSSSSFLVDADVGQPVVAAASPVPDTDFVLVSVVNAGALDAPGCRRLTTRLLVGLGLAALPFVGLSVLLVGSLRSFRLAEEQAISAQRMRSLGEAASLIAHEVRNSLNSLRLGLEVILAANGADKAGRRADILTSLRGEMQRLAEFTTELLTFSRGVVPNLRPVELGGFVQRVIDTIRPQADQRGVQLAVTVTSAPLDTKIDASLIHVVITNLVGNAIHFAGAGGPPTIAIEAGRRERQCYVRVVDNGPGVAAAVLPRLFEPFVTGRSNGVGIGLALSRRIARAHGGDLRYVADASGAAFELTVPGDV